MQLGLVFAVLG